ncbi:branched-chain amino acid ABC transporter permease [Rhizobium halophytocola]|uniref:Branched-chain amino acid transport system permease protein n=1 Tax=Rhizobium halophytocola TaxID=735519 RepID=A0ABS4DUN9_9HYPH|nr:branched-chain amino acid ABC transporter permease [Rhizobium halophytocola]MBP1849399.1 branched-chain amino acid transport system permease protein [Rhizobium halophytocola]
MTGNPSTTIAPPPHLPPPGGPTGNPLFRYGIWVVVALVLVLLPQLFSSGLAISTLCLMGTMIIFALSYNMLLGQTGLLSFGHAVFLGLGGFLTAHAMNMGADGLLPVPLMAMPLIGGAAGLVFGLLFGAVCTRRAGTAFAMITLGIAELVASSALILRHVFGGEEGISADRTDLPQPFGIMFGPQIEVYYLIAAWCFVSMLAMYAITRTPFGRMCNAVRDNPVRVSFIGYNTTTLRFIAFSLAGLFAGIAGGLTAINFELMNAAQMGAAESGTVILMAYIGGTGFFAGPIVGAVLVTYLQLMLSDITNVWQLYFGLMFIGIVMYAPNGIVGLLAAQRPLIARGALHRMIPYYLLALVPGLLALCGLSMVIEMTTQLSVSASEGTSMSLMHIPFAADDTLPWVIAALLLGIGGYAFVRAAAITRNAYDTETADRRAG